MLQRLTADGIGQFAQQHLEATKKKQDATKACCILNNYFGTNRRDLCAFHPEVYKG